MRQRAVAHTQRHSAHAAIFAKQLAMTSGPLGNGCTQPLPLTSPTNRRPGESDDAALFNQGTTCRRGHGHAAGRSWWRRSLLQRSSALATIFAEQHALTAWPYALKTVSSRQATFILPCNQFAHCTSASLGKSVISGPPIRLMSGYPDQCKSAPIAAHRPAG